MYKLILGLELRVLNITFNNISIIYLGSHFYLCTHGNSCTISKSL